VVLVNLNLRTVLEQKDVFLCFIDYEKAFNNVKHDLFISYLGNLWDWIEKISDF